MLSSDLRRVNANRLRTLKSFSAVTATVIWLDDWFIITLARWVEFRDVYVACIYVYSTAAREALLARFVENNTLYI